MLITVTAILKASESAASMALYGRTLRMIGDWVADSKLESPETIMSKYMLPALESVKSSKVMQGVSALCVSHASIGRMLAYSIPGRGQTKVFKTLEPIASCTPLQTYSKPGCPLGQADLYEGQYWRN